MLGPPLSGNPLSVQSLWLRMHSSGHDRDKTLTTVCLQCLLRLCTFCAASLIILGSIDTACYTTSGSARRELLGAFGDSKIPTPKP